MEASRQSTAENNMSKMWKATVVLSVALNLVSCVAIAVMVDALVDAQWENVSLFQQLSGDQQFKG